MVSSDFFAIGFLAVNAVGHDRDPVQIVDESDRAGMITADRLSQSLPDVKR